MKRIGIISDTHGTFDDTLREFLKDVDEIWHAGDIGSIELADRIAAFKPLRAVSGNIDGGMTRRVYPAFQAFECERVQVLMTHIGGYPRHYDPRAVHLRSRLRPAPCQPRSRRGVRLPQGPHGRTPYDRRRGDARHGGRRVAPQLKTRRAES